jgi:type IV pilus assembly protein PilO
MGLQSVRSSRPASSRDARKTLERLVSQFRGLDLQEPGQWAILPRVLAWGSMVLLVSVAGWFLFVSDAVSRLEQQQARELELKEEFRTKLARAANLPELRKQKIQLTEFVRVARTLLPDKIEMDAMLSSIGRAQLGRGLTLEHFRPEQEVTHSDYVEIPITLKVMGGYHDLGSFAADVAGLPRIFSLQEIKLAAPARVPAAPLNDSTVLAFEAKVRAYRYTDLQVGAPAQAASQPSAKQDAGRRPAKEGGK